MTIVARKDDSDYSPTWKWVDEEELEGRHVEFRRAKTENGDKVVWEIEHDKHGPVSVWLDPAVLVTKVRGELARRKAERGEPRLEPAEGVRINPGTKRPSKNTPGQTVWPFPVVEFEHGVPEPSAEEQLLEGSGYEVRNAEEALEEAVTEDNPAPGGQTDDVPF